MFCKKILVLLYLLICAGTVQAIDDAPPCFKELGTNFFKYDTTAQAFSMHRIGQSQWSSIVSQLQSASQQVPDLVNAQAKQLSPNPLERPFQPEIAVVLLKRALFVVFRQVMLQNYITVVSNEVAIKEMFEYIWAAQKPNMIKCLGEAAFASERITE